MINYERVAEKIFSIIKGHGHTLSMYKEDGMDTTDAAEARRFFVAKPNYMITLDEETNTIKINKNSDLKLEDFESIMKQMKNLARENMLNTQVKVFGKEIAPKDFAYQAKKFKDASMNESKLPQLLTISEVNRGMFRFGLSGKQMQKILSTVGTNEDGDFGTESFMQSLTKNGFSSQDIQEILGRRTLESKNMNDISEARGEIYVYHRIKGDRMGSLDYGLLKTFDAGQEKAAAEYAYRYNDKHGYGTGGIHRAVVRRRKAPVNEASLSRMTGSKKTSYQTLESVKMVVRHRKAVDEDVRGSRSRQIKAIFLEQGGERLRFPHNHLAGARAMARHMYEGGNMQDTVGEYIIESVGNLIQLAEFVRYTRTNKLINETSEDVIKIVKENIATLRGELKGLTGAKSYARISETISARETNVLEENDTDELKDMFTVRKFDEKFGQTLPLVNRLMNEKAAWRAALLEASKQTIFMKEKEDLAEEDIMEFENPVQQVGYKIGKVAKRMVETNDLSKFVGRVASKLIEGETLSDFEKTIVRNVMENAKVEEAWGESGECENCGHCDCTCDDCSTLESIGDQFELKMKMIEHEEIFVEGEERPYVCHHNKKGEHECKADSSYGAAKKAAETWGLDSTAGISATLTDVKQSTQFVGEDKYEETSCSQCGKSLGPGDSGVSHCKDHMKPEDYDEMQADRYGELDEEGLDEDAGHSIKTILSDDEITDLLTDLDREGDIVYGSSYFNKLYGHFLDTHPDEIPVGHRTGRPDNVEEYVLDNLGRDYGAELEAMIDKVLHTRKHTNQYFGEDKSDESEKCIRCRKGTMQSGDTMAGAAKECDRCGYQQQVDENFTENEGEGCVCKGKGFLYGDHGTFDCPRCKHTDSRKLADKVADAELSEEREWDSGYNYEGPQGDDHHAGEIEAGAHSGMPSYNPNEADADVKDVVDSVVYDVLSDPRRGHDEILELVMSHFQDSDDPLVDVAYGQVIDRLETAKNEGMLGEEDEDYGPDMPGFGYDEDDDDEHYDMENADKEKFKGRTIIVTDIYDGDVYGFFNKKRFMVSSPMDRGWGTGEISDDEIEISSLDFDLSDKEEAFLRAWHSSIVNESLNELRKAAGINYLRRGNIES